VNNLVVENYGEYLFLENTLADIDSDLAYYNSFQGNVEPYFAVLKTLDYMEQSGTLTNKGINATEFNEANSLLLSENYEQLTNLNQQEILMMLSCFMESEEKEPKILSNLQIPKHLKDLLRSTESYCKRIEEAERKHKISFKPWTLNYEYIEMLFDLFNGASVGTVCDTYQIFEGNLTRFLLKLLNIVDELKNVASLNKNVTLLEKLEDVRAYDFYKIAIPESLYLYI
jgi:superfamily II RNA helicase